MKRIVGVIRRVNAARVGILLVAVALVVGMASCGDVPYNLTITSTEGGSVTDPGEGMFSYFAELRIRLTAVADPGYRFVEWRGNTDTIEDVASANTAIIMDENISIEAIFSPHLASVAGGGWHTVGLTANGEVVAVGSNVYGQVADATEWTDITQVAAGEYHTVGLSSDNTVVAVGKPGGWLAVQDWVDIKEVAAGSDFTVGVAINGTVFAVGSNASGQLAVHDWTDIIHVAAGWQHTVGVCFNGTVVAVGLNDDGQCDLDDWSEVKQVAAGRYHTVGLRHNGEVVAKGDNDLNQCNVTTWPTIKQVAAGAYHTAGIKIPQNTLIARGDPTYGRLGDPSWSNIMSVAAGYYHTIIITWDGEVLAAGRNDEGQCDVTTWTLG